MTGAARSDVFRVAHAAAAEWQACCGRCLAALNPLRPDDNIGILYVSDRFAGDFRDILELFRSRTGVECWIGTTGIGIAATGIEYFDRPAVVAMVGSLPQDSFALFDSQRDDLARFVSERQAWLASGSGNFGIVHVDPKNAELFQLVPAFGEATQSFLVGALSSSRGSHDQAAGRVTSGGISGMLVSGSVAVATGLTQSCSPIGGMHEVTAARHNVLIELDDRPALDVFKEDIGDVLARDLRRVAGYIFAALPVRGADWGDYQVRNLAGFDLERGLLAIGEVVEPGQQVMFCRRDRDTAVADMRRMLSGLKRRLERPPRGGLYHSCLARGPNMFGPDSAELKLIVEELGEVPLVGFFGNGEISNSRLYTYTGVLSLFL